MTGVALGEGARLPPQQQLPGFYLHALEGDGLDTTSEGIFIYTEEERVALAAGDVAAVTGLVEEFNGETQIVAQSVELCGSAPLGAPRALPLGLVEGIQFEDGSWGPQLEAFEGDWVRLESELVVADVSGLERYGEFVACAGQAPWQFTSGARPSVAGFAAALQQSAARCLRVDDGSTQQNVYPVPFPAPAYSAEQRLRRGDRVQSLQGVLRLGRATATEGAMGYRLLPTQPPRFLPAPRPERPPPVTGRLRIAALNLENYFSDVASGGQCYPTADSESCRGAADQTELERQTAKLQTVLAALDADIYAFTELENDGSGAGSTLARVARLLTAAASRCSGYAPVPAGERVGTDAIAVGVLYCVDAVRIAPDSHVAVLDSEQLAEEGAGASQSPSTSQSPGPLVFTGSGASRVPLAVTFEEVASQERFTLVVNHWKSRRPSGLEYDAACSSSVGAADCDAGDGQGFWNAQRVAASQATLQWLERHPTSDPDPDVLLVGDFNAYRCEAPLDALRAAGYRDTVAAEPRYSYVYQAAAGLLDHVFASAALDHQVRQVSEWHINADESSLADYGLDYGRPPELFDAQLPFRASDHDPVLIGLTLGYGCDCGAPGALLGTPGDDVLWGTDGDDVICGGGGHDVIFGLGGNDCILTGAGDDWIFGGSGNDWIATSDGADRVAPAPGADRIMCGEQVDWVDCDADDQCSGCEGRSGDELGCNAADSAP